MARGSTGDDFRVIHAIRAALPTRRHAEMLFDQVTERLGEGGHSVESSDCLRRVLYRRDISLRSCFLPWPLLDLSLRPRQTMPFTIDGEPAASPLPRPTPSGDAPRLRNLGPGSVTIHVGPHSLALAYGPDGRVQECSRGGPAEVLLPVLEVLAKGGESPVELLAGVVAEIDLSTVAPGRVVLPAPMPGGLLGTWNGGLFALREALFRDRAPPGATWAAVDGFAGCVLVWGASRDETLARWRAEVERDRPRVPEPTPQPPEPEHFEPSGDSFEPPVPFDPAPKKTFGMHVRIEMKSDVPLPEQTPANTPAIFVELPPQPPTPPPVGDWVRLLGPFGESVFAARRRDADGLTLVGEDVLDLVDLSRLDELLDRADAKAEHDGAWAAAYMRPRGPTPYDTQTRTYSLLDGETGLPSANPGVQTSRGHGFHPRGLDGARLRTCALRVRSIEERA